MHFYCSMSDIKNITNLSKNGIVCIFLLIGFLSIQVSAQDLITVKKMNFGNCWLGEEPLDPPYDQFSVYSYTNFSAKTSNSFNTFDLPVVFHTDITAAMKDQGIPSYPFSNYDIWLHCSTLRAQLVLNFNEAEPKLVMYYDLNTGSAEVFSNNEPSDDFNYGQVPLVLSLYTVGNLKPKHVKKYLMREYQPYIKSVSYEYIDLIGMYQYRIEMKKSEKYKEQVLKGLLENDETLAADESWVEYDGIVQFAGDVEKIYIDTFPGF